MKIEKIKCYGAGLWWCMVAIMIAVINAFGSICKAIIINIKQILAELVGLLKTLLLPIASDGFKVVMDRMLTYAVLCAVLYLSWSKLLVLLQ